MAFFIGTWKVRIRPRTINQCIKRHSAYWFTNQSLVKRHKFQGIIAGIYITFTLHLMQRETWRTPPTKDQ